MQGTWATTREAKQSTPQQANQDMHEFVTSQSNDSHSFGCSQKHKSRDHILVETIRLVFWMDIHGITPWKRICHFHFNFIPIFPFHNLISLHTNYLQAKINQYSFLFQRKTKIILVHTAYETINMLHVCVRACECMHMNVKMLH